ncbi:MAG: hypothetical protein ACOX6S_05600 [Clostridia bacterium]|jgi:hypothetical protein
MTYTRSAFIVVQLVLLAFCILVFQFFLTLRFTLLQSNFYLSISRKYGVYDFVKGYALEMVEKNLEDSQHSLPYLEKAFSEKWFKEAIDHFIVDLFEFLRGRKKELPELSGRLIKEQVARVLSEEGVQEATKYVQYWLPIPDTVKLSDISTTKGIWEMQALYRIAYRMPLFLIVIILLLSVGIFLSSSDVKEGFLWNLAAVIAGGGLILLTGAAFWYGLGMSTYLEPIIELGTSFGIPNEISNAILWSAVRRILFPSFLFGFICLSAGSVSIVKWLK